MEYQCNGVPESIIIWTQKLTVDGWRLKYANFAIADVQHANINFNKGYVLGLVHYKLSKEKFKMHYSKMRAFTIEGNMI